MNYPSTLHVSRWCLQFSNYWNIFIRSTRLQEHSYKVFKSSCPRGKCWNITTFMHRSTCLCYPEIKKNQLNTILAFVISVWIISAKIIRTKNILDLQASEGFLTFVDSWKRSSRSQTSLLCWFHQRTAGLQLKLCFWLVLVWFWFMILMLKA